MLASIIMWFCSILSIIATIYYFLEKYHFKSNIIPPKIALLILVVGGLTAIILGMNEWFGKKGGNGSKYNTTVNGGTVGQIGDRNVSGDYVEGNKIIGDTSTTAGKRAFAAYQQIKREIINNFLHLSTLTGLIESLKPEKFRDLRRVNETELAYQDRAKANFLQYKQTIHEGIAKKDFQFSSSLYLSYHRDFSAFPNSEIVEKVEKIYDNFIEVVGYFENYEYNLEHVLEIYDTDQERTEKSLYYHQEALLNIKIFLLNAAANFCLISENDSEPNIVADFLESANIRISLANGQQGYKTALQQIAQLYKEKGNLIATQIDAPGQRETENQITDPYLLMLRKAAGLGNTLSEGELAALKKKEINTTETDPVKLFQLAAYSYLESDGHASATYFENAIKTGKLKPMFDKYARTSIHRLKNPDVYEKSIGVFVFKLTPDGNFARAKVKDGDVIVSMDGKTVNEPMDISSELGKNSGQPVLLGIIRDGQFTKVVVKGGESAGAALTQLIILNVQQL